MKYLQCYIFKNDCKNLAINAHVSMIQEFDIIYVSVIQGFDIIYVSMIPFQNNLNMSQNFYIRIKGWN